MSLGHLFQWSEVAGDWVHGWTFGCKQDVVVGAHVQRLTRRYGTSVPEGNLRRSPGAQLHLQTLKVYG